MGESWILAIYLSWRDADDRQAVGSSEQGLTTLPPFLLFSFRSTNSESGCGSKWTKTIPFLNVKSGLALFTAMLANEHGKTRQAYWVYLLLHYISGRALPK